MHANTSESPRNGARFCSLLFVRGSRLLLIGVGLLACAPGGVTASEPVLERDWYLNIGTYVTDFSTDANVGAAGQFGTFVRAEDDLGMEGDKSIFRVEGLYRWSERHALSLGYWSASRDGRRVIDEGIEFDGIIYDVGADLRSESDVSYFRLAWRWAAVRSGRGEAGFSVGLSTFDFDFTLEGFGSISDPAMGPQTGEFRASESVLAPAPTAGMFITYAATPRLVLRASANFLDVDFDNYEAALTETLIGIDWYVTQTIALGLGGYATSLDFKDLGDDPLQIDYRQNGLLVYVAASF